MLRATSVCRSDRAGGGSPGAATAVLQHDERVLRRKAISLADGSRVLVDLPEPVALAAGDELVLEDGGTVVVAPHDVAFLEEVADQTAILFDGGVTLTDESGEFFRESWVWGH